MSTSCIDDSFMSPHSPPGGSKRSHPGPIPEPLAMVGPAPSDSFHVANRFGLTAFSTVNGSSRLGGEKEFNRNDVFKKKIQLQDETLRATGNTTSDPQLSSMTISSVQRRNSHPLHFTLPAETLSTIDAIVARRKEKGEVSAPRSTLRGDLVENVLSGAMKAIPEGDHVVRSDELEEDGPSSPPLNEEKIVSTSERPKNKEGDDEEPSGFGPLLSTPEPIHHETILEKPPEFSNASVKELQREDSKASSAAEPQSMGSPGSASVGRRNLVQLVTPYNPENPAVLSERVATLERTLDPHLDRPAWLLDSMENRGVRPATRLENAAIPFWIGHLCKLLFYHNGGIKNADMSSPRLLPIEAAEMQFNRTVQAMEKLVNEVRNGKDGGFFRGTPSAFQYEICLSTFFFSSISSPPSPPLSRQPSVTPAAIREVDTPARSVCEQSGNRSPVIRFAVPPSSKKGSITFGLRSITDGFGLSKGTSYASTMSSLPTPETYFLHYPRLDHEDLHRPVLAQMIPLWRRKGAAIKTVEDALGLLKDRKRLLTMNEDFDFPLDAIVAPHFTGIDGQQAAGLAPGMNALAQSTLTNALLSDIFSCSGDAAFPDRARRIRDAMRTQLPLIHDRFLIEHAHTPLYTPQSIQKIPMQAPVYWVRPEDSSRLQSFSIHIDYLRLQPYVQGLHGMKKYFIANEKVSPSTSESLCGRSRMHVQALSDLQRSWRSVLLDLVPPNQFYFGNSTTSPSVYPGGEIAEATHPHPPVAPLEPPLDAIKDAAGQPLLASAYTSMRWESWTPALVARLAQNLVSVATFIVATIHQPSHRILVKFTVEDLLQADLLDHYEKYRLLQLNLLSNLKSRHFYEEQLQHLSPSSLDDKGLTIEQKGLANRLRELHDEAARLERGYIMQMILSWSAVLLVRAETKDSRSGGGCSPLAHFVVDRRSKRGLRPRTPSPARRTLVPTQSSSSTLSSTGHRPAQENGVSTSRTVLPSPDGSPPPWVPKGPRTVTQEQQLVRSPPPEKRHSTTSHVQIVQQEGTSDLEQDDVQEQPGLDEVGFLVPWIANSEGIFEASTSSMVYRENAPSSTPSDGSFQFFLRPGRPVVEAGGPAIDAFFSQNRKDQGFAFSLPYLSSTYHEHPNQQASEEGMVIPFCCGTDPLMYEPMIEGADTVLAVNTKEEEGDENDDTTTVKLPPTEPPSKEDEFAAYLKELVFFQVLVFARFTTSRAPQFIGATRPRPLTASKIVFYNETFEIRSSAPLHEILLHVVPVKHAEESLSHHEAGGVTSSSTKKASSAAGPSRVVASTIRLSASKQNSYHLVPMEIPTPFTYEGTVFERYSGDPLSGFVALSSTWTSTTGWTIDDIEKVFLEPPYADPLDPQYRPLVLILKAHYDSLQPPKSSFPRRGKGRVKFEDELTFGGHHSRKESTSSGRRRGESPMIHGISVDDPNAITTAVEQIKPLSPQRRSVMSEEARQQRYEKQRLGLLNKRYRIFLEKTKASTIHEARLFHYPIPLYESDFFLTERFVEEELQIQDQKLMAIKNSEAKMEPTTATLSENKRNGLEEWESLGIDMTRYCKDPALISGLAYSPFPKELKRKLWQERQRRLKETHFSPIADRELTDRTLLARYITIPHFVWKRIPELKPRSELHPRRAKQPTAATIDREVLKRQKNSYITVHLMKAMNLPQRRDKTPLEPFVVAQFVHERVASRSMVGSSPAWFETLKIPFHPYDFEEETLRMIDDEIQISIFDKVQEAMEVNPNPALGSAESHFRTECRRLCSIRIPFAALHQAEGAKMEGVFALEVPRWVLGYHLPVRDVDSSPSGLHEEPANISGEPSQAPTSLNRFNMAVQNLWSSWYGGGSHESGNGAVQSVSWQPNETPTIQLFISLWPPLQRPRKKPMTLRMLRRNIVPSLYVGPELAQLHQVVLKWKKTSQRRIKKVAKMNHHAAHRRLDPFVRSSIGDYFLICRYLNPEGCPPPKSVRTIMEAIRFVQLLPCDVNATHVGDVYDDIWSPISEMITERSRHYTELGLLLWHFLRYLTPEEGVLVVTGEASIHFDAMMLLHKLGTRTWHLIDPLTGDITSVGTPHGTALRDVRSVFSPHQIWANVQISGLPHRMSWDFHDTRHWAPCFSADEGQRLAACLGPIQRRSLSFTPVDITKAKSIELELREATLEALKSWRHHRPPSIRKGVGHILRKALVKAEEEKATLGSHWDTTLSASLEQELRKYLGDHHPEEAAVLAAEEAVDGDSLDGDGDEDDEDEPVRGHRSGSKKKKRKRTSSRKKNVSFADSDPHHLFAHLKSAARRANRVIVQGETVRFGFTGAPVTATYNTGDPHFRRILHQVYDCGVHEVATDAVDFAIGVYVKSYGGDVYAMWVFLAAVFERKPMI